MNKKYYIVLTGLLIACGSAEVKDVKQSFAVYELSGSSRIYPSARTGGNYMHNYYIPPAGTGSPWWPSWSPDGKRLVFSQQGSIWQIQTGDSIAYEIVNSDKYLSSPEWSPDGKYLAFTADDNSESINLKLYNQEDDKIPGEEIVLPETGGSVLVKGAIQSIVPLDSAELVVNGVKLNLGDLTRHQDPNGPGTQFVFEQELTIDTSSWITLQTYSIKPIHPIDDSFVQATTNPIWVIVGDKPVRSAVSAQYFIQWIDKLMAMADSHPGWRSEKEKTHVLG